MKMIVTRELAAKSLDLTHAIGERGPKTFLARKRVAEWLDIGGKLTSKIRLDVLWLLSIAV